MQMLRWQVLLLKGFGNELGDIHCSNCDWFSVAKSMNLFNTSLGWWFYSLGFVAVDAIDHVLIGFLRQMMSNGQKHWHCFGYRIILVSVFHWTSKFPLEFWDKNINITWFSPGITDITDMKPARTFWTNLWITYKYEKVFKRYKTLSPQENLPYSLPTIFWMWPVQRLVINCH